MNTPQRQYRGNYVLGQFVKVAEKQGEITSQNPGDLDAPAVLCPFDFESVNEAVAAAVRAVTSWRRLSGSDRLAIVSHYRNLLEERSDSVAQLVSFETGVPFWEARQEIVEALAITDYYLEAARTIPEEQYSPEGASFATRVRHFPKGVAAVVAPGICPIADSHLHFIPSLVYGNTVVMKASRHAPLVGQVIAEIFHDAQVPAGVFNLLQGDAELARRLASHSDVDIVFFTGSYETGLNLKKQTLSDYWKTVVLDMVGKNGVVLWEDCQYSQAVQETLVAAFLTTGQRRTTASRLLVHRKIFDKFVKDFHALAKKCSVGYGYTPTADAPFLGPLLNDAAVENYIRYQAIAVREGCEEIMRGKSLERNPKGHYVSPSIHLVNRPDPKSVYQKSEIFGPNVAIYPISEIEEAVEILNLSQHGLVASVYSENRDPFQKILENVRVGTVHWNRLTHSPTYRLPRGGLKKSGNTRPMGSTAWQQCTYPVSATELSGKIDVSHLPKAAPKETA